MIQKFKQLYIDINKENTKLKQKQTKKQAKKIKQRDVCF